MLSLFNVFNDTLCLPPHFDEKYTLTPLFGKYPPMLKGAEGKKGSLVGVVVSVFASEAASCRFESISIHTVFMTRNRPLGPLNPTGFLASSAEDIERDPGVVLATLPYLRTVRLKSCSLTYVDLNSVKGRKYFHERVRCNIRRKKISNQYLICLAFHISHTSVHDQCDLRCKQR